jgi:hypothetical protein
MIISKLYKHFFKILIIIKNRILFFSYQNLIFSLINLNFILIQFFFNLNFKDNKQLLKF